MSAFGVALALLALLGLWEVLTGLLMMLMGLAIVLHAYWRWTVVIALVLAVVATTAWFAGVRVPAPSAPSFPAGPHLATARTPSATASRCGAPTAERRPRSLSAQQWSHFRCRGRAAAGAHWRSCLVRAGYTDTPGAGCPGAERCCP